jgi:hypothetical protein
VEKQNLAQPSLAWTLTDSGVALEKSSVANLIRSGLNSITLPCVSATRAGRFSNADRKYITGNTKKLNGTRHGERTRRRRNERPIVKGLRGTAHAVHPGKNLKFIKSTELATAIQQPVSEQAIRCRRLSGGFDHTALGSQFAAPAITLN